MSSSSASLLPIVNAPMQAMFALLLSTDRCAEYTSVNSAAYAPLTLFAAMLMPSPVPQTSTPRSPFPAATASAAPEEPVKAEPLPEPEPEIEYDSFHQNYMRAADGFFRPDKPLTRAQAAVLLNRALGRLPDAEAAESCPASLLLDVPEDRADYADIVEAVLPHAYCAEEDGELWQPEALEQSCYTSGVHLRGNSGYVVDEDGRVLRGSGLLTYQGQRFLRADETGRIFADGALHPLDGEAVYASQDGTLLTACTLEEGYSFDEDGYYTTGNEALDESVRAVIAECTTDDMTQPEKLRACYDYVRAFKYLGRNAAFGLEVKVIPNDRLLEFGEKIFTTGKGDCYNFTAAFCLLARQLGYSAEPIVGECAYYWNWGGIAHGWVEVQIDGETWLFDPQIENYNLRAGLSNEELSAFQVTYETAHASYRKH